MRRFWRRSEEMRLQLLPEPGDVQEIRAHALAVIVRLLLNAEDEKVRLAAAKWLHEETGASWRSGSGWRRFSSRRRRGGERPGDNSRGEDLVRPRRKGGPIMACALGMAASKTSETVFEVFEGSILGGGRSHRKPQKAIGGAIKNIPKTQGETDPAALLRCPWYRDGGALMEHAIASMVKLIECGSPRVALEACRWLVTYAENLRSSERQGKAEESPGDSPGGSAPSQVCSFTIR